jgi:hypothetical protein
LAETNVILPVNPSDFIAVPDINFITLTWQNPSALDFDVVRVMRGENSYPTTPADGTLVYEGTGETVNDLYLVVGKKYYYTIFSKNLDGYYSSGAVASATIPGAIEPPPPENPPEIPPVVTPTSGGGTSSGGTTTLPTTVPTLSQPTVTPAPEQEEFPVVSTSGLFPMNFSDFKFFEAVPGGKEIFPEGNTIKLDSSKNLRVLVSSSKLPPGTEAIIFTIQKFTNGTEDSAFLLSKKSSTAQYEAIIALNNTEGNYTITIDILDKDASLLARTSGVLSLHIVVPALLPIFSPAITENLTEITGNVAPVALPVGIAVGVSQTVVLAGNVTSFYDLYLLLIKFFGIIAGLFRRKRSKPWGVVYDSITKQPIDPAYVVVEDVEGGKKKKTAITDLDGRYGFLIEPGTYSLIANKTHYKFPSEKLLGKSHDEMYENLYFGSLFRVDEDKVLLYNVPLDPVEFDWNEFVKNKDRIFNMYSRREKLRALFFNAIYYVGFGTSVAATFFSPTRINIIILVFYVSVTVFKEVWKYRHHVTRLLYSDGKPVSFAIVSAEIAGVAIPIVKKVTTDMFGRFYLLIPPGVYNITAQEKQLDGTYKEVYRKGSVNLKKGVLTKDIIIDRW